MASGIVELGQRDSTTLRLFQYQHERIEGALDTVERTGNDAKVSGVPGDRGRLRVETGTESGTAGQHDVYIHGEKRRAQAGSGRRQSAQHRPSCAVRTVMDNRRFAERGWVLYRGRKRESRASGSARRARLALGAYGITLCPGLSQ